MSPRKIVGCPKRGVKVSPRVAARSVLNAAKTSPKKAAPKKKAGPKTKLPESIPNGEILTDLRKNRWQVGAPIGKGGFGAIYSASEVPSKGKDMYAVKIEPKENGPLFVEMHFMMKACQSDDIVAWQKARKLSHLGIPRFIASGSHVFNDRSYRFVVMERFGKDVWSIFLEKKKVLPLNTILELGIQILDALEYIHSKGYVHADIKGSNLVFGLKKGAENNVYLIDFGLATKHTTKEYKVDPRTAHNGTIEYCSRDAHDGVPTRRGDLEVLAFNMLHWASSKLPWEKKVPNNKLVQEEKIKYMEDVAGLLEWCFGKESPPLALRNYLKYVNGLAYNEDPDYEYCRRMLRDGLKGNASKRRTPIKEAANNHDSFSEEEEVVVSPKRRSDQQASKKRMKK